MSDVITRMLCDCGNSFFVQVHEYLTNHERASADGMEVSYWCVACHRMLERHPDGARVFFRWTGRRWVRD